MLFHTSIGGRNLGRRYEYLYGLGPERGGRRTDNSPGKYVVLSGTHSANAGWERANSVSYIYDPNHFFDPFLGKEKVEPRTYRPRKEKSCLVIPSGDALRKEKRVRFELPISNTTHNERERHSSYHTKDDRFSIKPIIIDAHQPSSTNTMYQRETPRARFIPEEKVGKKKLPYGRHLNILTTPSDYVELYPTRPPRNGSYERLPDYRDCQLVRSHATRSRAPRRTAIYV